MFDTATYIDRRRKLAAGMDSGLALFLGNDEAPLNYRDNHYHFRQDSTYLYFWGLTEANLAATIDFDSGEEVLYGYEPTLDDIVWTGPLPTLGERGERIGVSDCRNIDRLKTDVQAALSAGRTVHLLPTYRGDTTLKLAALLDVDPAKLADEVSEPLVRAIIALRAAKEPQEVLEMEKAVEVSFHTHTAAMRATRPGLYEWEVVRKVEACHARHGSPVSFPIIFSVRGEVLHNHAHDNLMQAGQLVVHDSGATSPEEYASDITRTFPVSGKDLRDRSGGARCRYRSGVSGDFVHRRLQDRGAFSDGWFEAARTGQRRHPRGGRTGGARCLPAVRHGPHGGARRARHGGPGRGVGGV
jgi:Xaa-Pro aminopeptidase